MNWKNTWILVGLAAALFAFIFLVERRIPVRDELPVQKPLFTEFYPSAATSLQLRRGTQPVIRLVKTNDQWHFTSPFHYPAASFAVERFLTTLERLTPATHIGPRELKARKQTPADFGFDSPPVTIVIEHGSKRSELQLGARTPAGDQVYAELLGQPGYYVIMADALDSVMPRAQHDWRDTALFQFGDAKLDRAEINRGGAAFALALDPTNRLWRIVRPASHRADQLQVHQLLDRVLATRAVEFVADGPRLNADAFGLQPPEFEVTLVSGVNTQRVQFGHVLTNDPTRVYARLMTYSNVVLVSKNVVDLLATPTSELREQLLVNFAPDLVDVIEAQGDETFAVRKGANGTWLAGETPVDPVFVAQWLNLLSQLRATEFVKDVVTDFSSYALEPPLRRFSLFTSVTNASGPTNVLVARLEFGTNSANDRVFVRRWDEDSVYAISPVDYARMPSAAWQLREHRVWSFATNDVSKITVVQKGVVREALRQPNHEWVAVKGFENGFNPFAIEEVALKLGELNAMAWVARGPDVRTRFGFGETALLSVELRGDKPQVLTLEFGGLSPLRLPYALTVVDGQPALFEFPWTLYYDLQRYFGITAPHSRSRN
jgi:hypothetical protein